MAAFDLKTLQLLAPKGQKRLAYPFALAPPTINEDDGSIVEEDWELDDAEVYRDRVASRCQDVFELLTKLQKEKDTADRATRLLEELQARTKLARHKDAMPEDEDEYESWDDPSKDGGDGHWWPEFWSPLDLTSTSEMGKAVAILSSTVLMPLTKALFVTTQAGVVAPKRSEQFGLAHALQHARQKPQLIRAIDLSPLLHYTMAYRNEILASLNLLLLARTPHSLRIIPKHEEQKFTRNQLHRSYKFLHPILDFINLPHLVPFGDYAQATLEPTPDQVEGAQATMESYKLNPNTVPANVTIPSAAPPTPPPAQQPKGSPPEKRKKGGSNGQEDDSEEEEEESRSGDTDDDERPIPGGLDGKGKEKRNFHASDSQDKENHPHSDQRQANATAKLHELERRLAELQRTHDDLRHSTDELAETKEQLAGDVDSLRGTKETLEDEVGELREVKEALETEVYDLEQKKRDYAAGYE